MHQLSLVALYGKKDSLLSRVILECQNKLARIPGIRFKPYNESQIHGTIIGLDRINMSKHNLNMHEYRNKCVDMNISGMLNFFRKGDALPFSVQIGGFQNKDYSFTSLKKRPFERSFQSIGNKVILIGWPIVKEPCDINNGLNNNLFPIQPRYPNSLDEIRKTCQQFNILHKYHSNPEDIDNDFYFRIGTIDPAYIDTSLLQQTQQDIRHYLASIEPVFIEITLDNIYIASYKDDELPVGTTELWPINNKQLSDDDIWKLYN